jgi:hypothetical protein
VEIAPVLRETDDVSRRRWITKLINDELGTHVDPWAWDDWPAEFVETLIAERTKDVPDDG